MTHNTDIKKVGISAISGLAGGAAIASAFSPIAIVVGIGSIAGAVLTGVAEYHREHKNQSGKRNKSNKLTTSL